MKLPLVLSNAVIQLGDRFPAQRVRAIAWRWVEVAILAVGGGLIVCVAAPAARLFVDGSKYVEAYQPLWIATTCVAIAVALLIGLLRLGRLGALLGLRHFWCYPPAWLAAPLAYFTMWQCHELLGAPFASMLSPFGLDAPELPEILQPMFLAIIGLAIAYQVVTALHRRIAPFAVPTVNAALNLESEEGLRQWLLDDAPISTKRQDQFGLAPIAERIARRLSSPRAGFPSIAIQGMTGAGKTSLLELCKAELRGEQSVRLISIGLWTYSSAKAAVQACVQALLDALQTETAAPALVGLRDDYIAAMEGAAQGFGGFFRLASQTAAPSEVLDRFEVVASAIGVRFVLWVEDLERFAGASRRARGSARDQELVRSLLHLLGDRRYLTVVVASTLLHASDVEKVARYVERIASLDVTRVARLIGGFRKSCIAMLANKVDPDADREDDLNDLATSTGAKWIVGRSQVHSINEAILALSETPRRLKFALRSCLDVWTPLVGEINFDDVLCLCILRAAEPSAFEYIAESIDALRTSPWRSRDARENELTQVRASLARSVGRESARRPVEVIGEYLFPLLATNGARREKAQGVARVAPVDYWQRYMSVGVNENERDQELLQAIHSASDDDLTKLLMRDDDPYRRSSHLGWSSIGADRAATLLEKVVQALLKHPFEKWPMGSFEREAPGIVNAWQVILGVARRDEGVISDRLHGVVLQGVRHGIAVQPQLTLELEHYFALQDSSIRPHLLSREQGAEIRAAIHQELVGCYAQHPAELARRLKQMNSPGLLQLTWGLDRLRSHKTGGLPFPAWPEFAKSLLAAARLDPATVLPQIAKLVTKSRAMSRGDDAIEYDPEPAQCLFDEGTLLDTFMLEGGATPGVKAVKVAAAARSRGRPS